MDSLCLFLRHLSWRSHSAYLIVTFSDGILCPLPFSAACSPLSMGIFPQTINIWAKLSLPLWLPVCVVCITFLLSFYSFSLKASTVKLLLHQDSPCGAHYWPVCQHTQLSVPRPSLTQQHHLAQLITSLFWSSSLTSFLSSIYYHLIFFLLFILVSETVSSFSKDLVYSCHCLEQCLIQNRCLISICWMNDCELKSSYILVRSFPSPFLVRLFLRTSHFLIFCHLYSTHIFFRLNHHHCAYMSVGL